MIYIRLKGSQNRARGYVDVSTKNRLAADGRVKRLLDTPSTRCRTRCSKWDAVGVINCKFKRANGQFDGLNVSH